jgi:hypothetical protein
VQTSAGAPVSSTRVALAGCSDPIGGALGAATTDQSGAYRIEAHLPPIGVLIVDADTLHVRCYAYLNFESTARDSLWVQFFRDERTMQPQRLDIVVP